MNDEQKVPVVRGTLNGGLVKAHDGKEYMTEDQADTDAARRNKRAEEMGIETRYEVHLEPASDHKIKGMG